VSSVGFSPDGGTLGVARGDGTIELWDLQTRQVRARLRGHATRYQSWGLWFAPDGSTLASMGEPTPPRTLVQNLSRAMSRLWGGPSWRPDTEVIVIDLATGKTLGRVARAIHPFYSPDGRTLAVRSVDLSARLFDVPGVKGSSSPHSARVGEGSGA